MSAFLFFHLNIVYKVSLCYFSHYAMFYTHMHTSKHIHLLNERTQATQGRKYRVAFVCWCVGSKNRSKCNCTVAGVEEVEAVAIQQERIACY